MNICGIMVHLRPETAHRVRQRLLQIPGVEIHAISDEGRAVVTLEEDDEDRMADAMLRLQRSEGVLSASMIYHHREEDDAAA